MNSLILITATHYWQDWQKCVSTWLDNASGIYHVHVEPNRTVLNAYQHAYEETCHGILGYIHDDVEIFEEDWDVRVLKEFTDPKVGMVGFGGALGHGQPWLYQRPYHLPDLARQNFMSNMRNAEVHGERFTGERDVAVLDAFAFFVRRPILDKAKGWPVNEPYGYYMGCEWLCCEVHRQGYRIRLVGVDCNHLGGRTSTMVQVKDDYELAHRYFYDHNRDVMPWRVPE